MNVVIRTASWRTFTGPGRVGICLGKPRGAPAGYRFYRKLAPTWQMRKLPYEPYRQIHDEILAELDPEAVVREMQALADEWPITMMCFEVPPFDRQNFCHRRMVADWLEQTLGMDVPEYQPANGSPS